MNAQLSSLLEKEVSRKEFLGMSGLALASIFGFGSVIKLLTGKSLHQQPTMNASYGYGTSAYGGHKEG
jgi:hypothetical protein